MNSLDFVKICICSCFFAVVLSQKAPEESTPKPIIRALHIDSNIKYTYANTSVYSKILNPANKSQEVVFRVVLPEEAFISGLILTIKGKSYEAYVKGKEEAKKEYDAAVSSGLSAAHVYQEDPRNSKDFSVAVNVEPSEKVSFNLTYEEILSRKNHTYANEINVNPTQIVPDLKITVTIEDVLDIINVKVPEFKTTNEVDLNEQDNKIAKITNLSPKKVQVEWNPSSEDQKELQKDGLNGKLLVKYDVDVSKRHQQILVDQDGYFVHILRNDDLPTLDKHVVFVLDVSGSMHGQKMSQLQDAMKKILNDLRESDYFSVVLFSVKVLAWDPIGDNNLTSLNTYWGNEEPVNIPDRDSYIIPANKNNIDKAVDFIKGLGTYGGTNIMGGLRNGLKLAKKGRAMLKEKPTTESMIIFLTDGQPNSEESDTDKITANVVRDNEGVTIFSLGFGYDADIKFLKKISLANGGFARRIYDESDASLQLQNFYKEVASPVLSNVKFEYLPGQVETTSSDGFRNLFSGADNLVAGKVAPGGKVSGALVANTKTGLKKFIIDTDDIILLPPPPAHTGFGYLEKMWAYKTIKELLNKNTVAKNDTLENKAKDLALKYSFVTPLTSLVVVKPNSTAALTDEGQSSRPGFGFGGAVYGSSFASPMLVMGAGVRQRQAVRYKTLTMSLPRVNFASSAGVGNYGLLTMSLPQTKVYFNQRGGGAGGSAGYPGLSAPSYQMSHSSGGVQYSSMSKPGVFLPPSTDMISPTVVPESLSTTISSSPVVPHEANVTDEPQFSRKNYSMVSWLNQTVSEDGLYLSPPSSLTSDIIALNETNQSTTFCANGNPCQHFIYCILDEFLDDMDKFIPFKCHIDPKYLGVCCPNAQVTKIA